MKKRNYNSNLNTNNIGSGIVNPDSYLPIMLLGISFILLGIALVLLPLLSKLPDVLEMMQNLPTILIYVYHHNGFYFVTSPILIIISVILFLWRILKV
jgi:hypothetical protein